MRFWFKDGTTKKPMRTHQTFVRLSSVPDSNNDKKEREILLVAEPDASHVYKFDMVIVHLFVLSLFDLY